MDPVKVVAIILLCLIVPVFIGSNIIYGIKMGKSMVDDEHFNEFVMRVFCPAIYIAMLIVLVVEL